MKLLIRFARLAKLVLNREKKKKKVPVLWADAGAGGNDEGNCAKDATGEIPGESLNASNIRPACPLGGAGNRGEVWLLLLLL